MTIKEGSIYGLLGASGCGKTTVLSTIVGLKSLNQGIVEVFGGIPGDRKLGIPGNRIGYMPQEIALYGEFTIRETLLYFGRIHGMQKKAIKTQIEFLLDLLELSNLTDEFVRNLSGGQKRRVSFAVALLHNPELLILDEPTVGVDPMLRQNIWNHLLRLCQEQKKTILITTHYIEEARQAHYVGLMRHGCLLAEDSPNQLMTIYGLNSLEDVFLRLCVKDDSKIVMPPKLSLNQSWSGSLASRTSRRTNGIVYPGMTATTNEDSIQALSYCAKNPSQKLPAEQAKIIRKQQRKQNISNNINLNTEENVEDDDDLFEKKTPKTPTFSFVKPSWMTLYALMIKNLTKMWRNMTALLFVFLLPAVEVFFFCVAIGKDPSHLPLGIVNNEIAFNNCSYDPNVKSGCVMKDLSCRMIHDFNANETFVLEYFENEQLAYEATKEGNIWGYVGFHENFTQAFVSRMSKILRKDGEMPDKETRNQSTAQIYLDTTNQQVAFRITNALSDGYVKFTKNLLSDCDLPLDLADPPVRFNEPIYGSASPNFTEFMAPGIIIIIIFFLAVALTGEAYITEKMDGLMDRSWVAGVLGIEVMMSHILTQFLVLLGQTAITLIFIFMVFGIPCNGPIGWLIIITILQGFAGMCFGYLLSTLFNNQADAMQCAIGSFYPMLLLSGILWPLEGMPKILRRISWYLPCTAACQAMRDIMAKGWDISNSSVPVGIGASISWICIFIFASWVAMKFKSR